MARHLLFSPIGVLPGGGVLSKTCSSLAGLDDDDEGTGYYCFRVEAWVTITATTASTRTTWTWAPRII